VSSPSYDIVVVGAGIVGAACGYYAAQEGLRVGVIQGLGTASGATGAAMGHLVALDGSDAELDLCRFSQELWRELAPQLPAMAGYRAAGTLWVADAEDGLRAIARKHDRLHQRGLPSSILDREVIPRVEPALRAGLAGALLVPEDAVLDPVPTTQFLLEETVRLGGRLFADRSATRISEGIVELARGQVVHGRHVINAAGVDAPRLSSGIPVRPRKGHLLRFEAVPAPLRHQLVEVAYDRSVHSVDGPSIAFNAHPAADGTWTIGASREWGSTDTTVRPATVELIRARASAFLPQLPNATLAKSWAGLRPAMPDHLPWIGPLPGSDSVWVATGHEGLGITCSVGTGRLIVDAIQGHRSKIPIDPYLPAPHRMNWPTPGNGAV
jgi:glycine/D-amino acid oxidase-like deaminating enzyme